MLAELNEKGDRCNVYFRFDQAFVDAIKRVPGSIWVPREKGGPYWRLPLEMTSMRRLREEFGDELELGDALRAWGIVAVRGEQKMKALAVADDWPLEDLIVYKKLPKLAEWFRPYQRADVKFLASTSALNLLEPRLGKTTETIAALYEANIEVGSHLIVAPQKALDSVWRMEWERWTEMPVFTFSGETASTDRAKMIAECFRMSEVGEPFVFCTTADMIRRGLPLDMEMSLVWSSFTIDEFHKTGLPEIKNVFPQKAATLKMTETHRKYALSGTPMSGKPIKLWGGLHFLNPQLFSAKWRWAEQWLDIEKTYGDHRVIKGIKEGREEQFYEHLAPYAVRRLRTEVLPQLPEKQWIDVWCGMTRGQRKQYKTFEADAEIRIDEYHLTSTSILAEYTRLKQFSNAKCEVEILSMDEDNGHIEMKLKPTFDSGKLPNLLEKLAEQGIDPDEPEGESQAIVFSQFRETVDMVYNYLTDKGIKCIRVTGKVTKKESELAQRVFKAGNDNEGYRVCLMVTSMGVGITMDNVETLHGLDETWVPDDQEQVTDRAINTNRNHQVTVFMYRSKDSIEENIYDVNVYKAGVNKDVLDTLRQRMKEKGVA